MDLLPVELILMIYNYLVDPFDKLSFNLISKNYLVDNNNIPIPLVCSTDITEFLIGIPRDNPLSLDFLIKIEYIDKLENKIKKIVCQKYQDRDKFIFYKPNYFININIFYEFTWRKKPTNCETAFQHAHIPDNTGYILKNKYSEFIPEELGNNYLFDMVEPSGIFLVCKINKLRPLNLIL